MPGPFTPEEALNHLRLVTDSIPARLTDLEASAAFLGRLNDTASWAIGDLYDLVRSALDETIPADAGETARIEYQNGLHARALAGLPSISTGERILWKLAVGAVFGYGREPGVVTLDMLWELDSSNRQFVFSILERMK